MKHVLVRPTIKYLIIALTLIANSAGATEKTLNSAGPESSKMIGSFDPKKPIRVNIGCLPTELKTLRLIPEENSQCKDSLHIQKLSIEYPTGLQQEFEYDSGSFAKSGAPLRPSNYRLLPGNKCLKVVSAKIAVNPQMKSCAKDSRVKLLLVL